MKKRKGEKRREGACRERGGKVGKKEQKKKGSRNR